MYTNIHLPCLHGGMLGRFLGFLGLLFFHEDRKEPMATVYMWDMGVFGLFLCAKSCSL